MNPNRALVSAFALALLAGSALHAQNAGNDNPPPQPPPAREGGGPPDGSGGPGGPGFGGRFGMMRGPNLFANINRLDPFVNALADLNLSPEFNLSTEQEQKIATIRTEFKKASDTWRTDHRDQIDDLQADFREMRRGGGNEEEMRKLMDEARDLMLSAPSGDEEVKQVRAILTEDQVKQVDAKLEQQRAENERRRGEFGGGFGGGGGGPGGPGGERGQRRGGGDGAQDGQRRGGGEGN